MSEQTSIADLVKQVALSIAHLLNVTKSSTDSKTRSISRESVEAIHERFQLWDGTTGAAVDSRKRISLAYRLRDAPEVRKEVCSILSELEEALQELLSIKRGLRPSRTSTLGEDEHDFQSRDASDFAALPILDEENELFKSLEDCLKALMRIAFTIRKATPRDRHSRALSQSQFRYPEQFDRSHIIEKFPKLSHIEAEWFVDRLSTAMSQRRQFVSYCRHHRTEHQTSATKLHGGEHDDDNMEAKEDTSVNLKEKSETEPPQQTVIASLLKSQISTAASTLDAQKYKTLADQDEEIASNDDAKTLTTMTIGSNAETSAEWPHLAAYSKGKPEFECPLCHNIFDFKKERQWRRHLKRDLRPYVCCFDPGKCDFEVFEDRNAWFRHELQNHRFQWRCLFCQQQVFQAKGNYIQHLKVQHAEAAEINKEEIVRLSQEPSEFILASSCPFCDDWEASLRSKAQESAQVGNFEMLVVPSSQFRRHVATHMEQLALFSMPRMIEPEGQAEEAGSHVNTIISRPALTQGSMGLNDDGEVGPQDSAVPDRGLSDDEASQKLSPQDRNLFPVFTRNPSYLTPSDLLNSGVMGRVLVEDTGAAEALSLTSVRSHPSAPVDVPEDSLGPQGPHQTIYGDDGERVEMCSTVTSMASRTLYLNEPNYPVRPKERGLRAIRARVSQWLSKKRGGSA